MRAAISMLAGSLLLLAASTLACGGDEGASPTGVPQVDVVVRAVHSGDREALRELVEYGQVPCSTEAGTGHELCRAGEMDGTVVDALVAADCEGYFIRPDGMDAALDSMLTGEPKLYAVYKVPPPSPGTSVGPDYVVVFSAKGLAPGQVLGRALGIGSGEIVFVNLGCGQSPQQLAERLEEEGWSTPLATPATSPVAR